MPKGCVHLASWGKSIAGLFCLQPILFVYRQNSFSSSFDPWGKIKIHDFTLADQDWIGLMIFSCTVVAVFSLVRCIWRWNGQKKMLFNVLYTFWGHWPQNSTCGYEPAPLVGKHYFKL